jgi:hypothetical protein
VANVAVSTFSLMVFIKTFEAFNLLDCVFAVQLAIAVAIPRENNRNLFMTSNLGTKFILHLFNNLLQDRFNKRFGYAFALF